MACCCIWFKKEKAAELQELQEAERDNWQNAFDALNGAIQKGLEMERQTLSLVSPLPHPHP